MKPVAIYFDEQKRRTISALWWSQCFFGLIFIFLGASELFERELYHFLPWFQLFYGIFLMTNATMTLLQREYGSRHVTLSDEGIEAKVKLFSKVEIAWKDISLINLRPTKVSFVLKHQEKQEIDLGLLSYVKNKQLKRNLQEYASAKEVKVTGWLGDGE